MATSHQTLLLLGRDHPDLGRVEVRATEDQRSACALSAGATADAGGKHDPNEDAVLVLDDGDACLLAVADAHYGGASSHALLEQIAEHVSPGVRNLYLLGDAVAALRAHGLDPDDPSETTLTIVVLQRRARRGFGLSFGDSSAVLVAPDEEPRVLTSKPPGFVTPTRPHTLERENAETFRFLAPPGGLVLAYTDGVDECHYRRGATSVGSRHLEALFAETGADARRYAERLAATALEGVDGNPGGQDNVAIAVAATA